MSQDKATTMNKTEEPIICYAPTMITTNGIWQGDNPLDYSLPLFILQLTMVVVLTRIIVFILKPFRQPRVISEIIVRIYIYISRRLFYHAKQKILLFFSAFHS